AVLLLSLFSLPSHARDFYWEDPLTLSTQDSRFPLSATNGNVSVLMWQEIEALSDTEGKIWLSLRYFDGSKWIDHSRFAGPILYSGEVPSVASITLDSKNRILISAATGINSISVFLSEDEGYSFKKSILTGSASSVLAPKIFQRSDGGYFIFATRGDEDSFTLVQSRSQDGLNWTSFSDFLPTAGLKRPFLPSYVVSGSSDIIVFQALFEGGTRSTYQLYSSVSRDAGGSWSAPVLITNFSGPMSSSGAEPLVFGNYTNQRPNVIKTGNTISLVWERARQGSDKYGIHYVSLDSSGRPSSTIEKISTGEAQCYDPQSIELDGKLVVVWFDNRRGANRIYLALKDGYLWDETELTREPRDSMFGRVVSVNGSLEVYWQQLQRTKTYRLLCLATDQTVKSPRITVSGLSSGSKGRSSRITAQVVLPEDSSGIAGYNWNWGAFTKPSVNQAISKLPEDTRIQGEASVDGSWFFGVRANDYAGNWSSPAWFEYIRDTTPPIAPLIADITIDNEGYLPSNTFNLSWDRAEEDDIAGYTWSFEYIASLDYLSVLHRQSDQAFENKGSSSRITPASFDFEKIAAEKFQIARPASSLRTTNKTVSFSNKDNGIYALSVSAIDSVGNIGLPAVKYVVLNKYIPYTYITYIDSKTDETGVITLSLVGRGFNNGGNISEVYIDRDGKTPWDLTLPLSASRYRVVNDRLITDITLSDMEEGQYRVGLVHPLRGLYMSKPLLSIGTFGTVKFGNFDYLFNPPWTISAPVKKTYFSPDKLLIYSLFAFACLVFIFSLYGITGSAQDALRVQKEVRALITGDVMPSVKKKRTVALRRKGFSLRFKLTLFTTTLVISVVLIVSLPLGIQFSENQERTLARGLESRVNVLLESLASGARAYLPSQNLLELGFLPDQVTALDEALHATITGSRSDGSATGVDYVWATNDPEIASKIDSSTLVYGGSQLTLPENEEISKRLLILETEANTSVRELADGIASLSQEGISLALRSDAESVVRRSEIQTITRQLEEKLNGELSRISATGSGSWPEYNPLQLSRKITEYIFYKPVMYRKSSSPNFVHGTVRVTVSTSSLLETVRLDQQALVQTTVYVALFAVLMGILGSLLLASIIISPVRKLAAHVAMIRDTEDKEELEGKDIKLRTRDEIGLLGETINDMTHGLIKAASASKDLTVGKEVQKMFIPLDTDSNGRKLTSGSTQDTHADFFGYYEGAKGVSGDYFDYIKLDERHYAIIKCDVAGKGVPAALIMVEVATLFLDYFKDWKYEKNGYKLSYIVSRINDLIESRGFKGRFAAFTLCIMDTVSGKVHFCNAGDNIVHIYEKATHKMKTITLPESSAAGVFPTFMVDMKGGFPVTTLSLAPGDILFLYTDGIEEAKRLFRTPDLNVYICDEPGLAKDSPHGTHSVGQDNEELGPERVKEIIESVLDRKPYLLYKWHNAVENELFEFDFSNCEGTIEDVILALVSVEKIFRMYRDPKATEFDRVQVDRKVDKFLNKCFKQYGLYCGNKRDHAEYAEYMYYTHIREDDQYDDLTLLCVQKKVK
ncbi:MAG TPA: SpoIIE family protein phosphatase, partial [Treponemataceae bacterium]|nr:SpoIIE family protein phosphatase [Treponemataceae bacterium]